MSRKVALTVDIWIQSENEDEISDSLIQEVLDGMDYTFTSQTEGVSIVDTEIVDEIFT